MDNRIWIEQVETYDPSLLYKLVNQGLESLGGVDSFVPKNSTVLIKPNFLIPKPAASAVVTHPEIIRVMTRIAKEQQCKIIVGDSPAVGTCRRALEKIGLLDEFIRDPDITIGSFTEEVEGPAISSEIFQTFLYKSMKFAKETIQADVIINLPKLKTHAQMMLTMGVKNLYGCIVGKIKAHYHFQAGVDKEIFARMLVEIAIRLHPSITLLDGILAMEGNGPQSGTPINLGLLAMASNPYLMDAMITKILGFDETYAYTTKVAKKMKLYQIENAIFVAKRPEMLHLPTFHSSFNHMDIRWIKLPPFLYDNLRNLSSRLPEILNDKCKLCLECQKICPVQAIHSKKSNGNNNINNDGPSDGQQLWVDKKACLGCFCCQEVCPYGAIIDKTGPLLKFISRIKNFHLFP